MPFFIFALIAAAGVQKFLDRPGEPVPHRLIIEAEQSVFGNYTPLTLWTLRDEDGVEFTVLGLEPRPAELGAPFCAEVTTSRLLGINELAPDTAKACG